MKFKQELREVMRLAPNFQYVAYRDLEGLIKKYRYEADQVQDNAVPDEGQCEDLQSQFFSEVRANVAVVDTSFTDTLEACRQKLASLSGGGLAAADKKAKGYSTFSMGSEASQTDRLTEEYRSLYIELLDLNKMRKTNREAVRKIVKKFDKVSGEHTQDEFLRDHVDICAFAKENALKGIEEELLGKVRTDLFGKERNPDEQFRAFREATLLTRQKKIQKQQKQVDFSEYTTVIAYTMGYLMLFIWLAMFVQPEFSSDPRKNWQGYVVIYGVLTGVLLIAIHKKPADVSLMTVNIVFLTLQIITAEEAFAGFSNAGVIANGILLPFARALSMAGGAELCLMACLGKPSSEPLAMVRMCAVVAALSSVLNNTPIVFMMIPILQVWCSRLNMSVSKFMMPMSFAIMLGGTCSIVGSSANLVTIGIASTYNGKYPKGAQPEYHKPGFWSPAVIGLPVCIIGVIWMALTSRALLPKRIPAPGETKLGLSTAMSSRSLSGMASLKPVTTGIATPAVFSSEARFEVAFRFIAPLIGSTVEETGVTRLGPTVLRIFNIDAIEGRGTECHEPPIDGSPWKYVITEGDVVVFYCSSQQVNTVRQCQGLDIHNKHVPKIVGDRREKSLIEVTVGRGTPLEGKSLTDLDLRRKFNVVCLALFQKHERGRGFAAATPGCRTEGFRDFKRTALREGDVLLLEVVKKPFLSQFARLKWFSSMIVIENSAPPMRDTRNMILTMGSLLLLVILTSSEVIDIVALGFIIVSAFIALRVITTKEAWSSLKGDVLLTIAASFGIGQAMSNSGIAMWIGNAITQLCEGSELGALSMVYAFTVFLGLFLNNASVAVLVYPVAYSACVENAGLDPELVVLLIIMGAGLSFTTPMSYQTNQMVEGPGGYKFFDYVSFGGALQVASGVASVLLLYVFAQIGWVKHHHALWVPPQA